MRRCTSNAGLVMLVCFMALSAIRLAFRDVRKLYRPRLKRRQTHRLKRIRIVPRRWRFTLTLGCSVRLEAAPVNTVILIFRTAPPPWRQT